MATLSFEKKVQKFIEEEQLVEAGDRLLIACSGGVDSMGLLHFFLHFQKIWEIDLYVAHVDHMLRGEVSYEDRLFVGAVLPRKESPYFQHEHSDSGDIKKRRRERSGRLSQGALCLFCRNDETTQN